MFESDCECMRESWFQFAAISRIVVVEIPSSRAEARTPFSVAANRITPSESVPANER